MMLRNVLVSDLQIGDCPVSIAGFRPIEKIRNRPRKREVQLRIAGEWRTLKHGQIIGRVKRYETHSAAAPQEAAKPERKVYAWEVALRNAQ